MRDFVTKEKLKMIGNENSRLSDQGLTRAFAEQLTATDVGEIPGLMGVLQENLHELSGSLNELANRLNPVLRVDLKDPNKAGFSESDPRTPLGNRIAENTAVVRQQISLIRDLLQQLEL